MKEAARNEIKEAIKSAAKEQNLEDLDNPYEAIAAHLPTKSFEDYFPEVEGESSMVWGARVEEEINGIWAEI